MPVSIGIVGLPNVGKSTLFNVLTNNNILAANYPFATIEPNTGSVPVPDERLNKLAEIYKSNKIIPASVTFVDIAGLVAGASKGEGLGNQFLANIRSCDAIAHVVRAFDDSNVTHVDKDHIPKNDIEVINTELVLADLQTVENRLPRTEKEAKANPKLQPQATLLKRVKDILEQDIPLNSKDLQIDTELETWLKKELQLLTMKPVIYVFNVDEATLSNQDKQSELKDIAAPHQAILVCAKIEHELQSLDEPDRKELLESYGVHDSGIEKLIHAAYDTLGLQSYLTAGEKEVRAWTIKRNATAPEAAGAVHSDFQKGFIAAQVISYPDLIKAGSEIAAKSAGKVRTEGKGYIMQADDVVEFRLNT
jgi:GTP-binding protein YchF